MDEVYFYYILVKFHFFVFIEIFIEYPFYGGTGMCKEKFQFTGILVLLWFAPHKVLSSIGREVT